MPAVRKGGNIPQEAFIQRTENGWVEVTKRAAYICFGETSTAFRTKLRIYVKGLIDDFEIFNFEMPARLWR